MNTSSITLLNALVNGTSDKENLRKTVGVKDWQFNSLLNELEEQNYVKKTGYEIKLIDNPKTLLFREIAKKWDVEKFLHESNSIVVSYLTEPITTDDIIRFSTLSRTTVYRAISDLESIGAIVRKEDNTIMLDESKEPLVLFAHMLKTEREKKFEEPNEELIYKDGSRTIKKIAKGKRADGVLTAFSMFSDYGVEYHTTHDYYVEQKEPVEIQDILIHSVMIASKSFDKMGLTMSIIFYLKNKIKMDPLELRKIAQSFGISNVWIDVEGYIRNNEPKNPELFLPREEFIEKANLYDIPSDSYVLPEAYPTLFDEISNNLPKKITAYLIGGENMRIKELKPRTKDCDIVVENKEDFDALSKALIKMGYKPSVDPELSKVDKRLYPSELFRHPNRSTIDLFTKKILRALTLSSRMIKRSDYRNFENLSLGIIRNEDVFLLKAVTSREGDIQDLEALVQRGGQTIEFPHGKFDWNLVWEEILLQEHVDHKINFTETIFENLDWLAHQTKIVAPFLDKLQRHVVELKIKKLLREGKQLLRDIISFLKGGDITEQMIRNRIDAQVRDGILVKELENKNVFVRMSDPIKYPERDLLLTTEDLQNYLLWKFSAREFSSTKKYEQLVDELNSVRLNSVGDLDDLLLRTQNVMIKYEKAQYGIRHFSHVGAIRICVGFSEPKLGKNQNTNFFISEYDRYVKLLEK